MRLPWTWVAVVVAVLAVCAGALDCAGGRSIETAATVVGGSYSPGHTTVTFDCDGRGNCHPETHYYPPSWSLRLYTVYDNGDHWVSCDEMTYATAGRGMHARTEFKRGLYTGWLWGPFGVELEGEPE